MAQHHLDPSAEAFQRCSVVGGPEAHYALHAWSPGHRHVATKILRVVQRAANDQPTHAVGDHGNLIYRHRPASTQQREQPSETPTVLRYGSPGVVAHHHGGVAQRLQRFGIAGRVRLALGSGVRTPSPFVQAQPMDEEHDAARRFGQVERLTCLLRGLGRFTY
ncbi:MAG: hypothetical protein AAGG50_04250 [Bacteroidota bacterium]